jgi:hypothetical protein
MIGENDPLLAYSPARLLARALSYRLRDMDNGFNLTWLAVFGPTATVRGKGPSYAAPCLRALEPNPW